MRQIDLNFQFGGIILGLVFFTIPAFADFSGPVVSVLDGDTIEALYNQHPERIRLSLC